MTTLNNFVVTHDETGLSKFAFLMQALTDEVIDELTEKDEVTIGVFMAQMGEVIAWIGHGEDDRLPEAFRPFAELVELPNQEAQEHAAS